MSQSAKIITGLVLAVIVLGGLYYWYTSKNGPGGASDQSAQSAAETTTLPSGGNTSDASLSQDLNSIDAQMQGVSSDTADVSASVQAQAAQ